MHDVVLITCSTLTGAGIVALVWYAASQRAARKTLERQVSALADDLTNVTRVRGNRLYKERLEDVGFAASQAALRAKALRAYMEQELRDLEGILYRQEPK